MKLDHLICIIVVMFLNTGCSNSNSACKPPGVFDTLVISPFNGDATWVEEVKYERLPHGIAVKTTEQLIKLLEDSKMFSKVIQSSDCVDRAVKIDGKINSLIHKKGNFTVKASGKFINCQTGDIIDYFENSNSDSKSDKLPNKIAEEVADDFIKMMCVKPKE